MTVRRLIGSALALHWRAAPVASSVAVALTIATGSLSAVSAWLTKGYARLFAVQAAGYQLQEAS